MSLETALNLPLSGREKKDIILQRFSDRLDRDCTLMDSMCHNAFSFKLSCEIQLFDMVSTQTLVWDQATIGDTSNPPAETATVTEEYKSESPNVARMEHNLDLPIETTDGKGQKRVKFKKVKV